MRWVQARAVHVFTEAARVLRFRNICHGTESNELKLVTLGGLLRKSHESLREKYDCSCPELEELMVCSRRAGAFGARLTGAGWGGCSVHLVRQGQVRGTPPPPPCGGYTFRWAGSLALQHPTHLRSACIRQTSADQSSRARVISQLNTLPGRGGWSTSMRVEPDVP